MKETEKKGFRIRSLKISGRKDWVIFWVFAVIIAYIAGGLLDTRVNMWLWGLDNPWLTNLNEPQNYGRVIVAAILLAVLAEVVLFLCRKPVWTKAAVLAAALLFPLAVAGIYQVHCKLIVSVLWKEEPRIVSVVHGDVRKYDKDLSAEEKEQLLELCRSLEIIEDPEGLEDCMTWYEAGENFLGTDSIYLSFSEKYGHGYTFQLRVKDGYVYLWRGYQGYKQKITFYKDNGIVEWMESSSD